MPERNESADSFSEFFAASKPENVNDENKVKENDTPTKSAITALIKSQPVLHRRTPLSNKTTTNNKKMPLTTNIKNTTLTTYESDFDDNTSTDEKKKYSSLPPSKQRSPNIPGRSSDSKLTPRPKKKTLPSIRLKNRTKRLKKEPISESKQRVLSAQHEKLNQLQSRLVELNRQLENEQIETKTLRSIQKREEKAIRRYEDQEYDIHKLARDYTHQIADVKEKIINERENKIKLEKELEDRDDQLFDQTKRMKFYEKLVVQEADLDESDQLREKLKENEKKLKKCQDKIVNKEKEIEKMEKNYRREIHQELLKQRELKNELQNQATKYIDLQNRLEEKSRQLGVMHIYLQRGGRRPSNSSSVNLSKARSLQSLEDSSPRFREKILEYDKKRRDEEKLKPKPKSNPVPLEPLPKPKRQKYVPNIVPKPKPIKPLAAPVHVEKPAVIKDDKISSWSKADDPFSNHLEKFPPKGKAVVRRLSTPKSFDEDKSEIEDETIKKTPSPIPTKTIPRSEAYQTQPPVQKRVLTPFSPPPEPLPIREIPPTASLFKPIQPKSITTHEVVDKWTDIFDINTTDDSTKDDLLSKLISDEKDERKTVITKKPSPPPSQHPSMIMFEPSSIATNGNQKKTTPHMSTTSIYDFDQAIINLHEGKPVTAQPTTTNKKSIDPFESLFDNNNNNTTKSTHQMNSRDDTFTTTGDQSDPFESIFTHSSTAANTSTVIKPTVRQVSTQNDKLQRPKIVNNAPRSIPNRTVVEEIEEFVL